MCATKKESEWTLRSKDVLMLPRLAMMNVPEGREGMSVERPCRGGQEYGKVFYLTLTHLQMHANEDSPTSSSAGSRKSVCHCVEHLVVPGEWL